MAILEDLMAAQRRVFELQHSGAGMTSPDARRAMNRLMGLLRQATPGDLTAFDAWRAAQGQSRTAGEDQR